MAKSIFDRGITNIAKADWSGKRQTPNQEEQVSNFHVGIVMDDQDDQRMGRVWVYIPGFSTRRFDEHSVPAYGGTAPDRKTGRLIYDEKLRIGWVLCYPMMPYAGSDDFRVEQAPDGRNAKKRDPNAYGMWVQPRIGDHIGIMFAYGEIAHAFWMGMIPKQYRNFAVPGQPGEIQGHVVDGLGCAAAINPAYEKARSEEDPDPVPRRIVLGYAENLEEAGLLCDIYRGSGIAGAQRESPSYITGIKSAGWVYDSEKENLNVDATQFGGGYADINTQGHQFVMDDHPDHQAVRLRTSFGSQFYMNDAGEVPYIFMNTPKGNMWLEMKDDGDVHMFCTGSFSVHAKHDINFTADRDISFEAQRDLRILVRRDTSLEFKGETHGDFGANDLPPECLNYDEAPDWGHGPPKDMFLHNWANVHWTIDMSFYLKIIENWHITVDIDIFLEALNYDITLAEDMQLQARAYDITIAEDYMLTADNYDAAIKTDAKITTGGEMHIWNAGDYLQFSASTTHIQGSDELRISSGGDMHVLTYGAYIEEAAVILMNSAPATIATPSDQADLPDLPELPIIPDPPIVAELTPVWNDLTCFGVPPDCCEVPPEVDFLSKIVPQHFPWPDATLGRVETHSGTVTVNDERSEVVILIPEGAVEAGATAPLGGVLILPPELVIEPRPPEGEPAVYEGIPYDTDSPAEKPLYKEKQPPVDASKCTAMPSDIDGVSEDMKDFIKKEEGYRDKAYRDGDKWAVGYGHNINVGDTINGKTVTAADIAEMDRTNGQSMQIDNAEADRLLDGDIKKVTDSIDKTVTVPITQGQYDALTSFGYNVGTSAMEKSTMMKELNKGNFNKVPGEFMRWTKSGGKENAVLRKRRQKEVTRFFNRVPTGCKS